MTEEVAYCDFRQSPTNPHNQTSSYQSPHTGCSPPHVASLLIKIPSHPSSGIETTLCFTYLSDNKLLEAPDHGGLTHFLNKVLFPTPPPPPLIRPPLFLALRGELLLRILLVYFFSPAPNLGYVASPKLSPPPPSRIRCEDIPR